MSAITVTSAPCCVSTSDIHPLPDIRDLGRHKNSFSSPLSKQPIFSRAKRASSDSSGQLNRPMAALRHYRQEALALNDTPATTAPNSPQIPPRRQDSADKIARTPPVTLDIPGMTRSKFSPDGKISQRDVGAKLVIVMVGLPARGKSYITKKVARYLNWLQHDTRIFNVGERRRVAAGSGLTPHTESPVLNRKLSSACKAANHDTAASNGVTEDAASAAARILLNGVDQSDAYSEQYETRYQGITHNSIQIPELRLPDAGNPGEAPETESMDQSASFFDPSNERAKQIREQCATDTLNELLDYILIDGGSVGIFDATNSTIERRKTIMKTIRDRAGPEINVLFIESVCVDEELLERNIRLKLSGPDYKDKDPETSLADFKKRIEMYEQKYQTLGEYEEKNNMPFVQMIDVGRKVICHAIKGFMTNQAVNYLLNFNLAPRQIWITRHGESEDNANGKIGGDSSLTEFGRQYSQDLTRFLAHARKEWEVHELDKKQQAHLCPFTGDTTPPNPHYAPDGDVSHILDKNFCVWTSMLNRSIETAQNFDEEEWAIKQMRMLNEINAGDYEGMTYEEIKAKHRKEFDARREDKLHYRYPGAGGEGYLDVINRLRPVIVELERMTDHVLLIGHRSISRILLAYFKGLGREEVTDLDVPIGMLYCLEPKPYGVDLKAYRHNPAQGTFDYQPEYKLHPVKHLH